MMSPKLAKQLFEKYPKLLKRRNLTYGFECKDGWYWLIDNLCDTIQTYIDNNDINQVEVSQIKQKFGGLRFYTNGADDLIYGMIWFAEHLSYKICEKCGKPGEIRNERMFIETLCEECENENKSSKM